MASTFNEYDSMETNSDTSSTNFSLVKLTFDHTESNVINPKLSTNYEQHNNSENEQKIKTFLRIRSDVDIDSRYRIDNNNLIINKLPNKQEQYCFDKIFDDKYDNFKIFEICALPLLQDFLNGKNALIFTFGVTSSGKTFLMKGNSQQPGLILQTLILLFEIFNDQTSSLPTYKPYGFGDRKRLNDSEKQIENEIQEFVVNFDHLSKNESIEKFERIEDNVMDKCQNIIDRLSSAFIKYNDVDSMDQQEINVWVSYYEIYNDNIIDLLSIQHKNENEQKLMLVKDDNGQYFIHGLRRIFVRSSSEAYNVYLFGQNNLKKHMATTALNLNSSRSHSIFQLTMIRIDHSKNETYTSNINFCDLAGAERSAKTGNTGQRAKETNKINQSLCLLNQCISALITDNKQQKNNISFRSSKLTHVLQPFLFSNGGSFNTIINLNPSTKLFDESIFSLNFCDNIKAKQPVRNLPSYKRRLTLLSSLREIDDEDLELDDDIDKNKDDIAENNVNCSNCKKLLLKIEDYEDKIDGYQELLKDYKEEMKELCKNKENEIQNRNDLWQQRFDDQVEIFKNKLADKIDRIKSIENKLFEAEDKYIELEEKYENQKQKIRLENENFKSKIDCINEKMMEIIKNFDYNHQNILNKIESNETNLNEFESKLNNAKIQIHSTFMAKNNENMDLNSKLNRINDENKNLKSKLNQLNDENMDLNSKLNHINDENEKFRKELKDKNEQLAKNYKEMKELCKNKENEIQDLNDLWQKRFNDQGKIYQNKLDDKNEKIKSIQNKLLEAEEKCIKLEEKCKNQEQKMKLEIDNFESKIDCFDEKIMNIIKNSDVNHQNILNKFKSSETNLNGFESKLNNAKMQTHSASMENNKENMDLKSKSNQNNDDYENLRKDYLAIAENFNRNNDGKKLMIKSESDLLSHANDSNDENINHNNNYNNRDICTSIFQTGKKKRAAIMSSKSTAKKLKLKNDNISPSLISSPDSLFNRFKTEEQLYQEQSSTKYNFRQRSRRNLFK